MYMSDFEILERRVSEFIYWVQYKSLTSETWPTEKFLLYSKPIYVFFFFSFFCSFFFGGGGC